MTTDKSSGLWGGRFAGASDPLFRAFNDSLPFDCRLVQEDIAGSIGWAGALHRLGVLDADEHRRLVDALAALAEEAAADPPAVRAAGDEDVHAWVEARLVERLGDLGRKLHTGRSRNDQVATDLRLWLRTAAERREVELRAAQHALLQLAQRHEGIVIPGFTHLQRAQPVLVGHWCLAYYEMLDRDRGRLRDAVARAALCPLGCGALAGTGHAIDRHVLADDLGFDGPARNSLDAVSDRDFVAEALAGLALCAVHLSRLAEDLVFYASGEAGFVTLDDRMTSGSSLMPQKKNPDALELVRGKTGRVVGALVGLLTTLKGLPLAYNKDMQEDKEPLFDAMDTISLCLRATVVVLDGLRFDAAATRRAAAGGHANATDLADYLVERGIPFRTAHDIVGRLVRRAIDTDCCLEDLELATLRAECPEIDADVFGRLTIEAGLGRRAAFGGTAPARVSAALAEAQARLGG